MLVEDRYCPRCEAQTAWTNEADGSLQLACNVCALTITSPLTPDEQDRLAAHEARPLKRVRRSYQVV